MSRLIHLSNAYLQAEVSPIGAELKLLRPIGGNSVIWEGSEETWPRSAPTVFPILGGWPDDCYTVNGNTYFMQKNGFARTSYFKVVEADPDMVRFELKDTDETRESYPFRFTLFVNYRLIGRSLSISYTLRNDGVEEMPWIIGGHPGFRWNRLGQGQIRFPDEQTAEAFHPNGSIDHLIDHSDLICLNNGMFRYGAWSTDQITSPWIDLISGFSDIPAVRIHRELFPFITIWSMDRAEAAFVCIEPTTGAGAHGRDLYDRNGIRFLVPGEMTELSFQIELLDF